MRIVIDLQGVQSASRLSGSGRSSLNLARAIVRNRGEHEVLLALNGMLADSIEAIRAEFHNLLPQANIRVWQAFGPVCDLDPANTWRRQVAELLRESFLSGLKPDVLFVTSLFEGYDDDAVTSISIPHISEKSLLEEIKALSIPAENVINILASTSWDISARCAIAAFEQLHAQHQHESALTKLSDRRLKLAFISPLPPERSGIANYSAELLPELAKHYDIEVITPRRKHLTPSIQANYVVRDVAWFRLHAKRYDRVLYHIGNSSFHSHMFSLLAEFPGVVVLHDFFISDVQWHDETHGLRPHALTRELQHAHGYSAVQERFQSTDHHILWKYPCNLTVLQQAQGIIVHSHTSCAMANLWFGNNFANDFAVIPLLRPSILDKNTSEMKHVARSILGIADDVFLVCSFGLLGPSKLNHLLLKAWVASTLGRNAQCMLVFVGENHGGTYGEELTRIIGESGVGARIHITGWTSNATFDHYLQAADLAVQLRTFSRGETSAAVLDCMNHGLPTISNAHGSMAELPQDAVWMLPDVFTEAELGNALQILWDEPSRRKALGQQARKNILSQHTPQKCTEHYVEAIERFYSRGINEHALIHRIAALDNASLLESDWRHLASYIAQNHTVPSPKRQLLLDVTATARHDLKTGIERVVRAVCLNLLQNPPAGMTVEPIYLSNEGKSWHYRYARKFTMNLLNCPDNILSDDPIEYHNEDVLVGLDISGDMLIQATQQGLFNVMKSVGMKINFMVYDLLPLHMPDVFPPGANQFFSNWFNAIINIADTIVTGSESVSKDILHYIQKNKLQPPQLVWSHYGADISTSDKASMFDFSEHQIIDQLKAKSSFLMVGTIEPRKGHLQTLSAFEKLWAKNNDINLVIVGKEGWQDLPDASRRTIPEIVSKIHSHPELGRRLFWFDEINDNYLEQIYAASTCLIAASKGEGFGLPLIEAAFHRLPIIARDVPVFKEIAQNHAYYFSGDMAEDLAQALSEWLELFSRKTHPKSDDMAWLTWKESTQRLFCNILSKVEL
ncbi:MAG: glycosyltransferase [Legionella sp.]|nr:glycosyltransferase [Legionella sp.]